MYIDDMINPTFGYSNTGGSFGFNLIELNHAMSKVGYFQYYDDLTFRAANDPWIIEQPISQTAAPGQSVSFNTVAVGTAYQWQFNGTNIGGATSSTYTIASANATNAGNYVCVISGTNGILATSNAVLALNQILPGHFDMISVQADHSVRLNMSGSTNTNYTLLVGTNYTEWSTLTVLSSGNGSFQYVDSSATNGVRFYRLQIGP
jgi:hypothetical protein